MTCDMAAQMEVLEKIRTTEKRRDEARAAGHAATVRFLEYKVAALWDRMNEITGDEPAVHRQPSSRRLYPPTPTAISLPAALQLLADIVLARKRRDTALAAGAAAEVRRLEEQEAALRVRLDEVMESPHPGASRSGHRVAPLPAYPEIALSVGHA